MKVNKIYYIRTIFEVFKAAVTKRHVTIIEYK